jgi:nitroreductase
MTTFEQLATRQRACRRFDPSEDVSDPDVVAMLECAVHAPSAQNCQPWEFVVVRSPATRREFQAIVQASWTGAGEDYAREHLSPGMFADIEDSIAGGGLETAPVVVVVCADTNRVAEMWIESSIFPATQNLLLAAGSLGYGSCLTTGVPLGFKDKVVDLLQLPDSIVPMAAVFIGRPAKQLGAPRREPARQHMHREHFGVGWDE